MAGSRGSCGSRLPDMCYSQRLRSQTFIKKSSSHVRSSKVLAEDETSSSRCDSRYHRSGNRSSFMYSTSTTGLSKQNYTSASSSSSRCSSISRDLNGHGTQSSSLLAMQNARHDVPRSPDESGSDHDIEVGESLVSGISAVSDPAGWDSVASSSANNFSDLKSDLMERDAGVSRNPMSHYVGTLSWRDRYLSQPARADGSTSRTSYVVQGRPHGIGTIIASHKSLRKGSSSKAPHIDDLTAPLCLDKKARFNADRVCKSDLERRVSVSGMSLPKNSNVARLFRPLGQSAAGADDLRSKKKSNTQVCHRRRMRPDDQGARNREMSSIGAGTTSRGRLSNLVCSSAAVVLPSISSSALSSLVCSSAADVLPSVSIPSAVGAADQLRNRKTSRAIGLTEEGEASMGMRLCKGPMGNGSAGETFGSRGGQSQEQVFRRPHVVPSRSVRFSPPHLQHGMSCHRRPVPSESGAVAHNASLAFAGNRSLPTSYRHRGSSTMVSRNEDGLVPSSTSSNPFLGPIPAFGEEVSNQRGIRRRSLYGNQAARLMGVENEFPNRNRPCSVPSSSPWSVMHEMQYMQPNFSGLPPTRPPPLPPLATIFTGSSASESGFSLASLSTSPGLLPPSRSTGSMSPPNQELEGSRSTVADTAASGSSASSGETRPRRTVEGLSEILSALECLERDEDLSYEQVLMLEATILLGGVGLPDRHREMRVDIDNMSYEELLDLEERIGNVNTGLSEESIMKCMRIASYASPGVSSGYVPQDIEIKCSICQEEFEEAVELGVLECGHSHHISCIKQWLSQKNQCPICKSSAIP